MISRHSCNLYYLLDYFLVFVAALDVKKQKDLSGFYRHLLNQTVGEEAVPDRSADKSVISLQSFLIASPKGLHISFTTILRL